MFRIVHARLAPGMPENRYKAAVGAYERFFRGSVEPTMHGERVITPDEIGDFPDNAADYENFTYRYKGLDAVRETIAAKFPVAFVVWHHGARMHADYAVARVLPETAIFSRRTFQYGRVFSIPMAGAPALNLVRMNRFLRDGRPIYYYLDGAPLGGTVRLPMLGIMSNMSTGPLRVMAAVAGTHIVPVSNYYGAGKSVEIIFHPPLPPPDRLPAMPVAEIMAQLLDYLEADQRRHGPTQVMVPYLRHRERLARPNR